MKHLSLVLFTTAAALSACVDPVCTGDSCSPDGATASLDAGCPAGTFTDSTGACRAVGAQCGAGFVRDSTGWGCVPELSACDAGFMSVPGEGCTAVGWTQCPAGFTRTADGWSCEPTLPAAACTGATRAALGSSACVPVGDCAAAFPPSNASHFVDGALDGGDATHFSTISAALAAAPAGAVIAISPGTYRESLTVPRAVTLQGKCPAEVTLIGAPAIFVNAVSGVVLEGVTIRDSLLALRVEQGGTLTARHVILDSNLRSAVQTLDVGSRTTLQDAVVRGTRADPSSMTFGQGVAVSFDAGVSLTDVELTGNLEAAVFADRNASVTVATTVITDTAARASTGRLGWGIGLQRGASLTADMVVIDRSKGSGLVVSAAPSRATLRDVLVRRTAAGLDTTGQPVSLGVAVLGGATLTWTGGGSEGASTLIHTQDPGSVTTLQDVTVRDGAVTQGIPSAGIAAEDLGKVTVTRAAIVRATGSSAISLNGTLTADHLLVRDAVAIGVNAQEGTFTGTAVVVDGHGDVGAQASQRGTLSLLRCVVRDARSSLGIGAGVDAATLLLEQCELANNATAGVYAYAGGTAVVSNSAIRETQLNPTGDGQGVVVERGGSGFFTDVSLHRNHSAGLQVSESTLTATRVTVRESLPNATGTRGRGANANFGGATMTLTECAFLDNQQVGVFAFQAQVELVNSLVANTVADPGGAYGNGVEALTDGVVSMRGGAIQSSAGIAAVFAEGAGLLDGVRIWKNSVGLHAQDNSVVEETAAPAMLRSRQVVVTPATVFLDNQSKLSATTVPVPPP